MIGVRNADYHALSWQRAGPPAAGLWGWRPCSDTTLESECGEGAGSAWGKELGTAVWPGTPENPAFLPLCCQTQAQSASLPKIPHCSPFPNPTPKFQVGGVNESQQ